MEKRNKSGHKRKGSSSKRSFRRFPSAHQSPQTTDAKRITAPNYSGIRKKTSSPPSGHSEADTNGAVAVYAKL